MSDFRLRVFLAVGRHLSLTKAAQELAITQSAVSRHVRTLRWILAAACLPAKAAACA